MVINDTNNTEFSTKTFTVDQLLSMGINVEKNQDQIELDTLRAKIAQQEEQLNNFTNVEKDLLNQLTASKAANFDLLNALPVHGDEKKLSDEPSETEDVDIDDLFGR